MTDEEIRKEAYRKVKEKYEKVFRRSLSDKEIAEGLADRVSELEEQIETMETEINDWHERFNEIASKPMVSDRWKETIDKVESIMSIPAEEHIVRITIGDYSGVDISFEVKGWKEENE